jgi:hypothetical protein
MSTYLDRGDLHPTSLFGEYNIYLVITLVLELLWRKINKSGEKKTFGEKIC